MSPTPRISLCMITKDEELWLRACLESVRDLVCEIVIVDTGSKDNTLKIASEFGAIVQNFAWNNDFSQPRNISIARASGDWILVLDADERIDHADLAKLRELTLDPAKAYFLTQRHYSNDYKTAGFMPCRGEFSRWEQNYAGYFESRLVRFFPKNPLIRYRNRVHELVEMSIEDTKVAEMVNSGIIIHHYGHTPEKFAERNKNPLYSGLGERKVTDSPTDWKGYYELGVEYGQAKLYDQSIAAFRASLELNPSYVSTYTNLGCILSDAGRAAEALPILAKAIDLNSNDSEAFCNLGVAYLRLKKYASALKALETAVRINPLYVNAICNIGAVYVRLGRNNEAADRYLRALEISPDCSEAKTELGNVFLLSGNHQLARQYYDSAMKSDPFCTRAMLGYVNLFRAEGNLSEAIRVLAELVKKEEDLKSRGKNQLPRELLNSLENQLELEGHGCSK